MTGVRVRKHAMVPDLFKRMASVIKSAFTAASNGLLAFRRYQVGSWLQTISAKVVLREQTTTFVTSAPAHANAVAAMWYASMRCGLILPAVGLDVEWVKGSACPAALLQLSVADFRGRTRTMCVRLCQMTEAPSALLALLSDPRVPKAGVGVAADLERIEAWAATRTSNAFEAHGKHELVPLAQRVGFSGKGLASLSAQVLGEKMDKRATVRCSDWEASTLSHEQVAYAAADSRASLLLWRRLMSPADPSSLVAPPRALNETNETCEGTHAAAAVAEEAVDGVRRRGAKLLLHRSGQPILSTSLAKVLASKRMAKSLPNVPARRSPMYDGWLMLDPQGMPMCRLAKQRADWYVRQGLAVYSDPERRECGITDAQAHSDKDDCSHRCIRLLFTPNGPGNACDPSQLVAKANACVGCGASQGDSPGDSQGDSQGESDGHGSLVASPCAHDDAMLDGGERSEGIAPAAVAHVRWSVIPHSFRRLMPHSIKSRDSHDIVLLCLRCYTLCEAAYEQQRARAFATHGIARDTSRLEAIDGRSARCRSAANALLSDASGRAKLPAERRCQLENDLAAELGGGLESRAALTPEILREAAQPPVRRPRDGFKSPEERLLEAVCSQGGTEALHAFVASWRRLFVDTLAPTHLPAGWSISHRPRDPKDQGREAYRAQLNTALRTTLLDRECSDAQDDAQDDAQGGDPAPAPAQQQQPKCPLRRRAAAEDRLGSSTYPELGDRLPSEKE